MEIKKAVSEDAENLSKIALAAKAFWKYPESWLNLWKDGLTITPEFIAENEVYLAVSETKTVGFYALILKGENARLEHLWIEPEFIGRGIGRQLFAHALQTARSCGATLMEIFSDPNAEGFYRKQGAEKFIEHFSEIEGVKRVLPVMRIEL